MILPGFPCSYRCEGIYWENMASAVEAMPRRVTSTEEPGATRESRVTPDADGVQFDRAFSAAQGGARRTGRVVRLGGKVSGAKLSQPVRIVKAVVKNEPTRALRFRRKRVSSKKTHRTASETHELLLATDRLDLTAELIALLFKHRWQVELFFKWPGALLGLA